MDVTYKLSGEYLKRQLKGAKTMQTKQGIESQLLDAKHEIAVLRNDMKDYVNESFNRCIEIESLQKELAVLKAENKTLKLAQSLIPETVGILN